MKTTVAIVEDNPRLAKLTLRMLENLPDIECVATCASGEEALKTIPRDRPDVVLMDINLPGMSGIQCVSELKKVLPDIQIIMVTVFEDSERIFKALKAGADGYLIKSGYPDQLIEAIRAVGGGGFPMTGHVARKVVEHFHLVGPTPKEGDDLSPREQQVMELLSKGFTYKEIAEHLSIGVETVRTYVKKVCRKMHVRNRLEAVAKNCGHSRDSILGDMDDSRHCSCGRLLK